MRLCYAWLGVLALGVSCSSSEDDAPGAAATAGAPSAGRAASASGASGTSGGTTGTSGRGGASGTSSGGISGGGAGNAAGSAAGGSAGRPAGGQSGASAGASAGRPSAGASGAGTSGDAGMGGAPSTPSGCKRGIAANTAPGPAFSPRVAWWYNWAIQGSDEAGVEFVPMMWGKGDVSKSVPTGSEFLLTFNEPNFHAQSNITAQAAADLWPQVEAQAKAAGVPIVGPGMNFCGPADQCNGTSPYDYLKDFFAVCDGCQVDYVAVHWYNCDLPSLKDYLEPGGNREGFEQFDRPIWLTEFSCNGDASVAEQEAFMREAIPYLETSSHVFRYSWFSADPIPNARLVNDDGTPTDLGTVYIGLDQACDQ